MPGRWRVPLVLSACVVLAQLFALDPIVNVVARAAPAGARLAYPFFHVLFAPFSLPADWLNGGSVRDLTGFAVWAVAGYALVRLCARPAPGTRRAAREALYAAGFVLALAVFVAWGYWAPRPIPRLVEGDADALIFDPHSHTALSHDGRPGFGAAQNAAWHARAGFDAAFVTDHNACCAARAWRRENPGARPVLLQGEEISLSGIHVLALGIRAAIPNHPADASWDSTGALIRRLHADSVFLVPTLPEDWRRHTGAEWGRLTEWGVNGFEIWTSAPQAMNMPPAGRRTVIAWSRLEHLPVFGSTDMHGYGNAATVWNVVRLPGWRAMGDSALGAALLTRLRTGGVTANEVIALRRWIPASRLGSALDVPVNLALLLRTASHAHAAALLLWIWGIALAPGFLRRKRVSATAP